MCRQQQAVECGSQTRAEHCSRTKESGAVETGVWTVHKSRKAGVWTVHKPRKAGLFTWGRKSTPPLSLIYEQSTPRFPQPRFPWFVNSAQPWFVTRIPPLAADDTSNNQFLSLVCEQSIAPLSLVCDPHYSTARQTPLCLRGFTVIGINQLLSKLTWLIRFLD
jgi:hypothetical protein